MSLRPSSKQRKFAHQVESEIARIFGFKNLDINALNDKSDLLLRINNDKTFLMRDMGDGIGQFLTILFNIISKGNQIVLFDEPEIGIHASLQVELMNLILKNCNGPVLFSTHSVGLARSVADEIVSFQMKDGQSFPSDFKSSKNFLETLGEMSFSAWREIGCDGVLFVEGPSDVKIISEWLRRIEAEKKWALIPLGGSETINSDGVEAIKQVIKVHSRVAVIIDSEKDAEDSRVEEKRIKFQNNCKKLKIPCFVTTLRATENYLSQRAIREACGVQATALKPFEKLKNHGWGKRDVLKIASKMTKQEVEQIDLVQFIQTTMQQFAA